MFVALAVGTVIYAVKKLSEAEAERRKKAYETYAAIEKAARDHASKMLKHKERLAQLDEQDIEAAKRASDVALYDSIKAAAEAAEAKKKAAQERLGIKPEDEIGLEATAHKVQKAIREQEETLAEMRRLAAGYTKERGRWLHGVDEKSIAEAEKKLKAYQNTLSEVRNIQSDTTQEISNAVELWQKMKVTGPGARFEGLEAMGRRIQEAAASASYIADERRQMHRETHKVILDILDELRKQDLVKEPVLVPLPEKASLDGGN
jgi:hypothetical protein